MCGRASRAITEVCCATRFLVEQKEGSGDVVHWCSWPAWRQHPCHASNPRHTTHATSCRISTVDALFLVELQPSGGSSSWLPADLLRRLGASERHCLYVRHRELVGDHAISDDRELVQLMIRGDSLVRR
jgi:hypothetical protein